MIIRDEKVRAASNVLNQTEANKRITVYHAFGYFLANNLNDKSLMGVNKVLNNVSELAILDKPLLKKIVSGYFDYYSASNTATPEAKNMFDILKINQTIGLENIEIINNNFNLFKIALASYNNIKNVLFENDEG